VKSQDIIKTAIGIKTKEVASALEVSPDLVAMWKNGNAKNDIDRVIGLYKETKDIEIIKYICIHANGFFMENLIDENLNTRFADIHKEINKTVKVLLESYEDEHISLNELFVIMGTWGDLKCKMDSLINELLKTYALEHDIEVK
jgi:transcriptional regulator with XRE-family HTH domain